MGEDRPPDGQQVAPPQIKLLVDNPPFDLDFDTRFARFGDGQKKKPFVMP